MVSLVIAVAAAVAAGAITAGVTDSRLLIGLIGMVAFVGVLIGLTRFFAVKLQAIMKELEAILEQSKAEANRMAQRFSTKPIGSQKVMQQQLEKVMEKGVMEALKVIERAEPLYRWHLLAESQVSTVKFQLNYQIRRFEEADAAMAKMLITDPLTMAMKLARLYKQESPDFKKTFTRGVRRFRNDKGTLLYAVYTWALMKRKQYDEALEVLSEARDKTESEVILRNWEAVANQKYKQFSNQGLGEQWFALHLEPPPKARASRGQMKSHPLAPRGKRIR